MAVNYKVPFVSVPVFPGFGAQGSLAYARRSVMSEFLAKTQRREGDAGGFGNGFEEGKSTNTSQWDAVTRGDLMKEFENKACATIQGLTPLRFPFASFAPLRENPSS